MEAVRIMGDPLSMRECEKHQKNQVPGTAVDRDARDRVC